MILGGHPLGGGFVLTVDAVHHTVDLLEGGIGLLGEGDGHPPVGAGLLAALVAKALGDRHILLHDTHGALDIRDAEEVLPRGLGVKGQLVGGAIHQRREELVGDGLGSYGGVVVHVPLIEGEGGLGIGLSPGGHDRRQLGEGRAEVDADAVVGGDLLGTHGAAVMGIHRHGAVGRQHGKGAETAKEEAGGEQEYYDAGA